MVRAYRNNVFVITKDDFICNLKALEKVLQKLAEAGFKANAGKSFFGRT